jgi:hypothetical protein
MDILKGNYKLNKSIILEEANDRVSLKDEFRQKAIENIGGSMVFVERDLMTWVPDNHSNEK